MLFRDSKSKDPFTAVFECFTTTSLYYNYVRSGHTPHTTAIILVFGQKFRPRQLKKMLAGLKMDKTILSLNVCHAKAGNTIIILLVLNTIFMRPKATPVSGMYKIPDF